MGTILIWSVGILLMGLGVLGCFVHRFPGPILTYLGILEIQFVGGIDLFSTQALILCAVVVILAKVVERFIPKITEKIHEISKQGKWGSVVGSILGLLILMGVADESTSNFMACVWLILVFGIVPFAVTYLFEMMNKKPAKETLMATTAAYLTFLLGTVLKLGVCFYCIYAVISVR